MWYKDEYYFYNFNSVLSCLLIYFSSKQKTKMQIWAFQNIPYNLYLNRVVVSTGNFVFLFGNNINMNTSAYCLTICGCKP